MLNAASRLPLRPYLLLSERRAYRFVFELLVLLVGYFAYHLVRGLVAGRAEEAFQNAAHLIHVEQTLGIFWEAQLQAAMTGHHALVSLFNWIYIWGHIPVIGLLALWLFLFRGDCFARYRNAFLISGAIGLVFFVTLPMAPPRFIEEVALVDTVTEHSRAYRVLQPPALVNQYAAMPSLHFGWNLLVGVALYQTARVWWARAFGLLMPFAMFIAVVVTANHYFLDPVVGGVIALVSLWLADRLHHRFAGTPLHAVLV